MGDFIKASWSEKQPGRGLFALVVTVILAFIITAIFDIGKYTGIVGYYIMSCIGMFIVLGVYWKGRCLSIELPQPFKGMLLLAFAMVIGLVMCYGLINFLGKGALHPYVTIHTIMSIITMFFLLFAFNFWPFNKLSLPAGGFLFIITAYLIAFILIQLYDFSVLSYPAGLNPSPVEAVPFYQEGGPLAALSAPFGLFLWEHAITFALWGVAFLWGFALLGMWPFSQLKIEQPLWGLIVTVSCLVLSGIAFSIGVYLLKIEPLTFMSYGVSFVFGILITFTLFQMWPGSSRGQVTGGFINLAFSVILAIIGYYVVRAFCLWHFGDTMTYPDGVLAIDTMMLGVLFPLWAAYGDLFDFWPLPPLSKPDDESVG